MPCRLTPQIWGKLSCTNTKSWKMPNYTHLKLSNSCNCRKKSGKHPTTKQTWLKDYVSRKFPEHCFMLSAQQDIKKVFCLHYAEWPAVWFHWQNTFQFGRIHCKWKLLSAPRAPQGTSTKTAVDLQRLTIVVMDLDLAKNFHISWCVFRGFYQWHCLQGEGPQKASFFPVYTYTVDLANAVLFSSIAGDCLVEIVTSIAFSCGEAKPNPILQRSIRLGDIYI